MHFRIKYLGIFIRIKHLGIFIGELFPWNKQIDNIWTELLSANGLLPKLRHFVPKKYVYHYISLYFTIVSFMAGWFGPTQLNLIWIESSNYKDGAFRLLLTQN